MNTKKHGIGHVLHGALNLFTFSFKHTKPQHCKFVKSWGGGIVEEKLLLLNISQSELHPRMWT